MTGWFHLSCLLHSICEVLPGHLIFCEPPITPGEGLTVGETAMSDKAAETVRNRWAEDVTG